MKICDENTKPNALLCTEGDPIHCVITSQTKYSEPLNPVFYYPSIATKILSSMIIAIIPTFSIRFINNLLLLPKDDLMTRGRGGLDTSPKIMMSFMNNPLAHFGLRGQVKGQSKGFFPKTLFHRNFSGCF